MNALTQEFPRAGHLPYATRAWMSPARYALSDNFWRRQDRLLARNSGQDEVRSAARKASGLAAGAFRRVDDGSATHWPAETGFLPLLHVPPASRGRGYNLAPLPDLIVEISEQLVTALNRPCVVRDNDRCTRVEFLDRVAYVVVPGDRLIYMELRDAKGAWCLATQSFTMHRALDSDAWLDQALAPWLDRIEGLFGPRAEEAYRKIRDQISRRFRDCAAVGAVNRQVRRHVDRLPSLWRIFHRLPTTLATHEPSNELFSMLWNEAETWATYEAHYPDLIEIYYLCRSAGQLPPDSGLHELRAACRKLGLGRAGWRFLAQFGSNAYADGAVFCEDANALSVLLAYVDWQARAGLPHPLPDRVGSTVLQVMEGAGPRAGSAGPCLDQRLASTLSAECNRPDFSGQDVIELDESLPRVCDWLLETPDRPDRNQWRAGWGALLKAYRRWMLTSEDRIRWNSPVERFTTGKWVVSPVNGDMQLSREGDRMQHCVKNYQSLCVDGEYRVFSVEQAVSGQPVATIGLEKSGDSWTLSDVRGRCNRDMAETMTPVLRALAERMSACGEPLEI